MDRIRFDSPFSQAVNQASRNAGTIAANSTDLFSKVLQQQLSREKADSNSIPRSQDGSRATDDPRNYSEAADSLGQSRTRPVRHQDDKTAITPAKSATPKTAAKTNPPVKDGADSVKTVATDKTGASDKTAAGKPDKSNKKADSEQTSEQTSGKTSDKHAARHSSAASGPANAAAQSEGKLDADGKSKRQRQPDSSDEQAATANGDAVAGETAAAALPVPVMVPAGIVPPTGSPDALLQGAAPQTAAVPPKPQTLPATAIAQAAGAQTVAGLVNLAEAAPDPSAQGLTFGAVIKKDGAAPIAQKNVATAPDAAISAGSPGNAAAAAEPIASAVPPAGGGKSKAGSSSTDRSSAAAGKALDTGNQPSAVNPLAALNQRPTPGTAPPGANTAGSNLTSGRSDFLDSFDATMEQGDSDDIEFSSWSQYLGSSTTDDLVRNVSARQSSFVAQLKQNLHVLPPHEQVAIQIQNAMRDGSSRMTVDLKPAELGRVEIKLSVDKDKNVTATVIADRPATLDMLQRDAKALERALQDAGLQANSGSLSFNLRDAGGQSGGQSQGGFGGAAGRDADGTSGTGAMGQPARTDVVATADGYVDLET